jgi:hypothetical protein
MHYLSVTINRDETTGIPALVGAWELPILEAKHGEERLVVGELVDFPKREWPADARSEMNRLGRLYGVTGSGDNAGTFAEKVYGSGSLGIKALDTAIKEAIKAASKLTKKPARKANAKATDLVGATA